MNEGKQWQFYVDNDPEGFALQSAGGGPNSAALTVKNVGLVKMFRRSTGHQEPHSTFYLQATGGEMDGRPLIEILTNKSVEEITAGR